MNTIDISTDRVKGAFTEALKTTRLGDTIVYHIGEYAAGLHRDPAMKAQEGGYVALVQKKLGPHTFKYMAQRTKKRMK